MNCSQCASSIDYRFATTCLNCGLELVGSSTDPHPLTQPTEERISRLKLRHHLLNFMTTLAATTAGLFVGAVVIPFCGWGIYFIFEKANIVGDLSCGAGNALGFLLLIGGAQVGSVSGGIFGFAHRYYKPRLSSA